jgi:tape measure domain-containing protein
MAAQDAELKLKVSLDLAFFRQQLAGLGQAAAGTPMPVQIKFDRRSVQNELNALGANIRRRNYRLNIETNLSAEIAKADTLARKLTELSGKIKASAGGAFSQGPQGAAGLERFMREQGLTGRAFGVQQAQERIARQAVSSRLEKGPLSKGGYNIAGLEKIIRDLGGTPTGGRKDLAAQAKKLVEEADGIADAVFDSLKDLQMKLRPIRGQAQASAARSMPNLNEMLDRMANLTSNPRAAQRMLRALPESRITTDLVGAANRQAAFQQQFPQGFTLPGFNAPKAFDPLLKAIAKDFTDYARTVNISDPWVGQVSNGIANVIAKAAASPQVTRLLPAAGQTSASRMTQQMFAGLPALQAPSIGMENAPLSRAGQYMLNKARRALELPIGPASPYAPNPFAGQATVPSRQYFQSTMRPALPAAGGTSGLLSALEAQLGASRGMLGTGGGIATSLFTGRGLVNPGVSMLEPVGLSGNYRQMAAALANQAANPALAHRQIADIGFGGVPTSATGLSGQALNAALNQAFLQRRGLGISGAQSLPIFGTGGVAVQQNIPGMAYRMGGGGLGGSMGQFPMTGMMGPSTPMSINARTSMFGGGGGMQPPAGGGGFGGFGGAGGFGGFGRAMGGINLPGAGAIRELGDEFGFATKQVLLFGQAYKLLAFVQNFPGQVATAVSELQSFRNTLLSVTGSASAAADANEFILAAVEKYSIPLQSARDGFTKLFASMEPAGFAAGEIQNLFLGISKAAATYGLSADKVDRVNYAFAQMASKGQVMSEELKGQLGDVLPGAMGIFAEAAGFKGPDAIQKFGKALEDGVYKGGKMRELLRNVALGMNKEFGPGAEGAAKTFQGAINRMQTATQKLYESFEPAAIGVLNTVAVPLVNTLKNLTDGVNAYFSGQQAATPAAQDFANALKTLVPTLSGIGENLKYVFQQVSVLVQGFGAVTLQASRLLALPIVGYLAGTYVQVLLLTTAYKALAASGIGAAIVAITRFIAQGVVYAQVTLGMRVATQQTTVAMYQFGTAVQTVMIKSVIGVALVAIGALISRFVELQNAMASVSGQAKGMQDAAKASAKLGDVAGVKEAVGNMNARVETYKNIKNQLDSVIKKDQAGSSFYREIPSALASQLMATGLIVENSMRKVGAGYKVKIGDLRDAYALAEKQVSVFNKTIGQSEGLIGQAQKQSQKLKEQGGLGLEAGAPDEKALRAQQKAAEEARKLADDKRKYEADLMKLSSQQAIDLNEMEFDQWKNLQQAKYDFLEAGQNDWMSREIKFQRDLQAIEIRRIEAIRRARIETVKAETEAQSRAYVAGGAGIGATTGLMQGSTGISSGPHFDVRRADGSRISEAEARALFDPAVRRQLQMTSGYGPRNTGIPGASTFHRGIDLAGPANTPLNLAAGYSMQSAGMEGGLGYTANVRGPQGQMYKVGHLQEPKSGMPASRVRAEAKKDYSAALASQEAINAKEKENAQIKYANIQAQQELNVLIREYTASIVPIEQQRLENTLLQNRIDLMTSGLFGEALDTEQKISETREKAALGVQMANDAIAANNKLVKDGILTQEQADRLNASNVEKIKQLTEGLQNYVPLLRERLKLEQSSAEASLMGQIRQESPLGGMGLSAGFIGPAADKYVEAIGRDSTEEEASRFAELQNQLTLLETRNEAIKQSIYGIGDAFGEAMTTGVAGLISGTATAKEVFASFLQSIGQALSQAASQMIATYIAIGIAKMFAGFGGGGKSSVVQGVDVPVAQMPAGMQFANGGIAHGGFRAFANGGVVSGPTLGLVGEGRYNEAIVPLPDGKSIPVQLGGKSARDLMGGNAPGMPAAPSLNMKFETTKINGVEYVSREQLEQAMTETRRASIAGGAQRGMSMTLDKIKQSPSTRSSIGIR